MGHREHLRAGRWAEADAAFSQAVLSADDRSGWAWCLIQLGQLDRAAGLGAPDPGGHIARITSGCAPAASPRCRCAALPERHSGAAPSPALKVLLCEEYGDADSQICLDCHALWARSGTRWRRARLAELQSPNRWLCGLDGSGYPGEATLSDRGRLAWWACTRPEPVYAVAMV